MTGAGQEGAVGAGRPGGIVGKAGCGVTVTGWTLPPSGTEGSGQGTLGGQKIVDVITVNGARVMLENGGWGLVRASSNTPNLVVVCESPTSQEELRAIFEDLDAIIRVEPNVGDYDQTF